MLRPSLGCRLLLDVLMDDRVRTQLVAALRDAGQVQAVVVEELSVGMRGGLQLRAHCEPLQAAGAGLETGLDHLEGTGEHCARGAGQPSR